MRCILDVGRRSVMDISLTFEQVVTSLLLGMGSNLIYDIIKSKREIIAQKTSNAAKNETLFAVGAIFFLLVAPTALILGLLYPAEPDHYVSIAGHYIHVPGNNCVAPVIAQIGSKKITLWLLPPIFMVISLSILAFSTAARYQESPLKEKAFRAGILFVVFLVVQVLKKNIEFSSCL